MKRTSVTRLRGGGVQANLVVQLFNLALVYQSSLPNFEGRIYLQSWERYSAATRVGGTTQDKRSPKGHNRVEENPPEKESRARRYRVHAGTVWQVSDVRRLYVRCQIFQWPSPWRRMTAVWPDRRMSDDFTSGSQVVGSDSGISTPDQETLATVLGKVSSDGIWAILVNDIQLVSGDWSSQMEGG